MKDMKKIIFLLFSLILFGCVASAVEVKNTPIPLPVELAEQEYDEMLELAYETDQERVRAIYVVVISEPEVVTAKPPEK